MNEKPMTNEELNQYRRTHQQEGLAIFRYDHSPIHSYPYDSPWLNDADFSAIYEKVRDHTLVDRARCHSLYLLAKQFQDIEGDVLEIGVWRGGTAGILTSMLSQSTVFLAGGNSILQK